MKRNLVPLIFGTLLFALSHASAAVLVQYPFATASPNTPAANTTAGDAAWVGMTGTVGFSSGTSSAYVRTEVAPETFDSGKYLTLTLSAQSGYVLNLSSVVFGFGTQSNGTLSITTSTQLRTDAEAVDYSTSIPLSLDSGTGNVSGGVVAQQTNTSNSNVYSNFSSDLTGAIYQGLTSITFRWYVYDNTTTNSGYARYDYATINGDVVAVPEPGTWSLVLMAGIAGLLILRKRRRLLA